MKRFLLLLCILTGVIQAQTPADIVVRGRITRMNNMTVANWPVQITAIQGPDFNETFYTDQMGQYNAVIPNAGTIGPNRMYVISTPNCDSTILADTISNQQGTVREFEVNFTICGNEPPPPPCFANFNFTPLQTPRRYLLSWLGNNPEGLSFKWFSNGSLISENRNTEYTFPAPGQYNVCLVVKREAGGCEDEVCLQINVPPAQDPFCNAHFSIEQVPAGIRVKPDASFSPNYTYTWHAAGFNSHDYDPILPPALIAPFELCLTVTDNANCQVSICDTINLGPPSPAPCNPEFTIQFLPDSNTNIPGRGIRLVPRPDQTPEAGFHHTWIISTGDTIQGIPPVLNLSLAGQVEICHTVSNQTANCSRTLCKNISIDRPDTNHLPCKALFDARPSAVNPLRMIFTNRSLGISPNTTYRWTFGNNSSVTGQENPEITFPAAGIYNVCLKISTGNCEDTYCQVVKVGAIVPPCDASFRQERANTPGMVRFIPHIERNNLVHQWLVNGELKGTAHNFQYHFAQAGTYEVCHIISAANSNCSDTACVRLVITNHNTIPCTAQFDARPLNTPLGMRFMTPAQPHDGIPASYAWDFGDNQTGIGSNPSHIYNAPGRYNVCLTVTRGSCSQTFCKEIEVRGAGPDPGQYTICGQVFAGSNTADAARVRLIWMDPVSGAAVPFAETAVDSAGKYKFENVPAGRYLIRAELLPRSTWFRNYIPTYFGSRFYWRQAEVIEVTGDNCNYIISLIYAGRRGGPGLVRGNIVDGPGRIAEGAPVRNATIILTQGESVEQFAVSNVDGGFEIENVPFGTYKLWADIPGIECVPVELSISEQVPVVDFTVQLGEEVLSISAGTIQSTQIELYPNPASTEAWLQVNATIPENLQVEIFGIAGNKVWSANSRLGLNNNLLALPIGELNEGIYLIRIQVANHQEIKKLIISK